MTNRIKRPNFIDFGHVSKEDLDNEQSSNLTQVAESNKTAFGTGIRLDFPEEPVIFNSDLLSATQSSWVALNTFDGRGILENTYTSKDVSEGSQISVTVTDARLSGYLDMTVTLIGKAFDDSLFYENIEIDNNGTRVSHNHFKEVTNILFQNFLGNANTSVDGYGSYDLGGTVLITEASSLKVSTDLIASEQITQPNILFRNYKTYDSGKTLTTILTEAIGPSNDVTDLDIITTTSSSRSFTAGATTEVIYGQKFKMSGDNIQKISLLLKLDSGSDWTGSLVISIRPLQTSSTCPTDFLPDNEIEFDPSTVAIASLSLDKDALADRGVVLDQSSQIVDFVFTDSNISNPTLSKLVKDEYYVATIQRTGSTTIGTLTLEEATNSDVLNQRLTVFSSNVWTDVSTSTFWYRIWSDSIKIASGTAYDQGTFLVTPKTIVDNNGVSIQSEIQNLPLANTSESTENYVILQKTIEFTDSKSHPKTGDLYLSKEEDAPVFSTLEQAETLILKESQDDLIILGRVKDNNSKSNNTIIGTLDYPGLALGNVINVINPGSDLLTQNVIGSTIIPNILKPTLKYRIISQTIFTELYGDANNDGNIDVADANIIEALDGYSLYFNTTGTYTQAQQESLAINGSIDILQILRSELSSVVDGYEITSADLIAVNSFISNGTAFPNGNSSYTRVQLELEPITFPWAELSSTGTSTLNIEAIDNDLINGSNFNETSNIDFSIGFVPTWSAENIEILDLRRFVNTTFLDFTSTHLQTTPESGGINNEFIAGDLFLQENIKNLDGSFHTLDFELNSIELELPDGNTQGSVNLFTDYIVGKMKFSDGTFVSLSGITNNQVRMQVSVSSHVKNVSGVDGYIDFDGYSDGYGDPVDEVIATYIDHTTGLLRLRAFNIVHNTLFPELRTRILITVSLKKAGFINSPVTVLSTDINSILSAIT